LTPPFLFRVGTGAFLGLVLFLYGVPPSLARDNSCLEVARLSVEVSPVPGFCQECGPGEFPLSPRVGSDWLGLGCTNRRGRLI